MPGQLPPQAGCRASMPAPSGLTSRIGRVHDGIRSPGLVIQDDHEAYAKLLDVQAGDRTATMRTPFWAWAAKKDAGLALLHPHRADGVLEWAWPVIPDILGQCEAIVTADAIEIIPLCPPIEKFPTDVRCSSTSSIVELRGLEPLTPSMPWRCATSCATAPCRTAS